jgi:hypothetical protein
MSMGHIFTLPHGNQRIVTTESAIPTTDRKRKRVVDDELDSGSDDGSATGKTSRSSISPVRTAFFTPEQREQYTLAGLEPGEEVPSHPFPHAPARPHAPILERARNELHGLNPPLAHIDPSWYEPSSKHNVQDEGEEGLREKHLAALTTVMHHMLLKGDYQRAGRAWGLLLRSGRLAKNIRRRDGYLSMDVTTHNRWGIGAEILMRNNQGNGRVRNPLAKQGTSENSPNPEDMQFSEEGFRAAREYYGRLIVQYPEHHQRKGAKASTFYAAMFSLWIYEVSQRSKHSEQKLVNNERESTTSPAFGDPSSDGSAEDGTERLFRAIKAKELEDARIIASRLNDVLGSPPHDKNAELLQIRGMVALWVGELQGGDAQVTALERAKDLFLRSRANGGMLWEGVEHIVEEDDW